MCRQQVFSSRCCLPILLQFPFHSQQSCYEKLVQYMNLSEYCKIPFLFYSPPSLTFPCFKFKTDSFLLHLPHLPLLPPQKKTTTPPPSPNQHSFPSTQGDESKNIYNDFKLSWFMCYENILKEFKCTWDKFRLSYAPYHSTGQVKSAPVLWPTATKTQPSSQCIEWLGVL